ncbi:MAG: heme ABC transporter ATP-binding protein [Aggregatilineales bacterium]
MSIEAQSVTVSIRGKTIVQDVSLCIEPGQFVAIVGANGAGKSTFINVMSGDIQPEHGTVTLNGQPLRQWDVKSLARMRAVLPQSSSLNAPFTALEIVLMGRSPHIRGIEQPHDYAIAREALAAAQVSHLEQRAYTTLSGGEKQRVQLARVLAQIWEPLENGLPRYLLIDEPTNNLDIAHQHSTLKIAKRFADQGVGVLAILHDLNLASQYADQVVVINEGAVLANGTPDAVFTPEIIQNAFHISVTITRHPHMDCPLIIPIPDLAEPLPDVFSDALLMTD